MWVHAFHHLPLVAQEPLQFLSYTSVSARTHALEEVYKLLQKGALELVDPLVPNCYNWLLLVQDALCVCVCVCVGGGGGRSMIDLSCLNRYITFTIFKMEMVSLVPGSIEEGTLCSRSNSRTSTSTYPFFQTLDLIIGPPL